MIDPNAIRRVVRLAQIEPGEDVIEVGAGLGTLTLAIAEAAGSVVAVEIDRRLVPALAEVLSASPNVRIVQDDALRLDLSTVTGGRPHRLVSNLPYNIATPLVAKLLEQAPEVYDFSIVVQREAGERLAAPPGSKTYGAISVMVAYYCHARVIGKVPPTVFWPPPAVESVIVRLTRRPAEVRANPAVLKSVVRAAFSQRRKTIRNTISSGLMLDIPEVEEAVRAAGLDPGARSEMLSLEDFAALTRELSAKGLLRGPGKAQA